mmetsp:Transcript_37184/g.98980  ORF Transcript_37184/g.98980 Transcript_37184/m.98980 type:complete len:196 (+) Transcript_37184:172-759(+)
MYIRIGEAGALSSGSMKGETWSSRVVISSRCEESRRSTSQTGNMPLWNEIVEIEDYDAMNFKVTLLVYKKRSTCFDQKCVERTYSVVLTIPDDIRDQYCDEWIELPAQSSSQTIPELRGSVRLRLSCSSSLDVVTKVQQGLCPYKCSVEGYCMTFDKILLQRHLVSVPKDNQCLSAGRNSPSNFWFSHTESKNSS